MFELLKNLLTILSVYKAVTEYGPKIIQGLKGSIKSNYCEVNEIFPKLLNGDLKLGDTIECVGFLSKYSQTFLPMSYVPTTPVKAKETIKSRTIQNGRVLNNAQMDFFWQRLQVPVIIMPMLGNYRLCFLYREDFNTFIYPVNDGKEDPNLSGKIMVPDNSKPIPVLIDINKHAFAIDKFVYLKARLITIPDDLTKYLSQIYTDVLFEHNSNFYNPYAPCGSFICLSLTEQKSIELMDKSLPDTEAQIFTECHVENLDQYQDIAQNIVSESIPDLASPALKIVTVAGYESLPYLTEGDISFVFKKPNIVGLYSKIHIFDNLCYIEAISKLHKYSQAFSRNIQNISQKVIGKKLKTQTDFVFDPTKAALFDSRGILNLKTEDISKINEPFVKETIDWYTKAK